MVEQAPYSVIGRIGELEVRRYPPLIVAIVSDMDDDDAFGLLFRYISGNNRERKDIEMTTPVLSVRRGEKVPMTAPVINEDDGLAFVLPTSMSIENAPVPLDEKVAIRELPSRTLAVLRFKGVAREKKEEEMTEKLLDELGTANVPAKGKPFLMRYDPPFKPGFLRRNEVAVEIEWKGP